MTSSSCLLSDLNGAANAVLKVEAGDLSPRSVLLPPSVSDNSSIECSTPSDDNGAYVREHFFLCRYS